MAQRPQIVDITKSYLPGDPNAFVQNLVNTDREDGEEKTYPLLPYEGYNFLPTSYGYKSYFGTNSVFGISALASRAQFILLYQIPTFKSRLIALCEDGIWVCTADGQHPDWVQVVTHTFDAAIFEEWTWCVIENILYMYKQGTAQVYKTAIGTWTIPAVPGGPTDIVTMPSDYQIFGFNDDNVGDGTDFWNGNYYTVSMQYSDGTDFGLEEELMFDIFATDTTSFSITVSGTPPNTADRVRVYIFDDDLAELFYKDFLLSAFPLSIPNLTGFAPAAGFEPQTLYETAAGTPELILSNDLTITSFVPSFLNMSGQMGIFRAGLRLGFWDSANSVSWSSNLDLTDFTPAVENLAGNTIFGRVVGRIVHCRGHGEGFIIYSTKSIVGVIFSASGNLLWDGKVVLDNTGISFSKAVTCGKNDSEHYVYATSGIYAIGKYNALSGKFDAEPVLTEIYDFLRESRDPVYMSVLQDRYLCFSVIPDDYIGGGNKQSFSTGIANPYLGKIDWYIPTEDHPVDTVGSPATPILPEQMLEILFDLLSGQSSTKRKDGEWVPLWNTTVDVMDDRYYSWWRRWAGESAGRISYLNESSFLDSLSNSLSAGDIETYLDATPLFNSQYGYQRPSSGIRSFWGLLDADEKENNETLMWGQMSEWDDYIKHATANKERLEGYLDTVTTTVTGLSGGSPANSDITTDTVVGYFVTGEGNNEILTTEGPTEYAAREVILRRTFTSKYKVTKRVRTRSTYTFYGSITFLEGDYSTTPGGAWGSLLTGPTHTVSLTGYASQAVLNAALNASVESFHRTSVNWFSVEQQEFVYIGPYNDSGYSDAYIINHYLGDHSTHYPMNKFPSNSGFANPIRTIFYDRVTIVDTSYVVEKVTTPSGFSQFKATVTQWDRVKFGLYGNFEILESIPAEAMTAKIWDSVYPQDQGSYRNQIISYGGYKAISPFNLKDGTIGSRVVAPNPNGTDITDVTGYDREGITSLHTEFTLPGASFLLQQGSITDVYPTFVGAFVYDLHLKKWGKYKGEHKLLLESTPINTAINGSITYTDLGANAGILDTAGAIKIFDSAPLDSWIRYGKIGYYRLGMSDLLEVRASMRMPCDFRIISESSMDGKVLDLNKNTYHFHYGEVVAEDYMDISARWHTVKISGNYDLTGLEVRATLSGRR